MTLIASMFLLACAEPTCDDTRYLNTPFESGGVVVRSTEGGFEESLNSGCGLRDGVAVCGDQAWPHGQTITASGALALCVVDAGGELRCDPRYGAELPGLWDGVAVNDRTQTVCVHGGDRIACAPMAYLGSPSVNEVPVFSKGTSWLAVTASEDDLCGLTRDGRVVCNPGLREEFRVPGRWDRLERGCALAEDGAATCIGVPVDLPCEGVTYASSEGGLCFESAATGPVCLYWSWDGSDLPIGYRPSEEARGLRGGPRCGIEPGGIIVCGRRGPDDEEDWIRDAIRLP